MRLIERLYHFLEYKHLSHHSFERGCGIANGYLKKQARGRGTIGSEILEKISERHLDLSLNWLITGKGTMLIEKEYGEGPETGFSLEDHKPAYLTDERTVRLLRDKIAILENALSDKEKIIRLLEKEVK